MGKRYNNSPPKPGQGNGSPPKKVAKQGASPPTQAGRRSATSGGTGSPPAGVAQAAGGGGRTTEAAAEVLSVINDAEFPPLPAGSPPAGHTRGSVPLGTASPTRRPSANPRSPRSQAIFERDCLPLAAPLKPNDAVYTPPSPPAPMETTEAHAGGIDDEVLPADATASPPRYDGGDAIAARVAAGAAGAARRPPKFPDCAAVVQLQRKPQRRRNGTAGAAAQQAAGVAASLPPAGAVPESAPGGYDSSKPVRRMRVMPLSSALKEPTMLPRIKALVLYTSFVVYHVIGFLELYGAKLAEDAAAAQPTVREKLMRDACESTGKLFGTNLIFEAIGIANAAAKGKVPEVPTAGKATRGNKAAAPPALSRLKQAAREYLTQPGVAAEFDKCDVPDDATVDGLRAQKPNIAVAFKNQLLTGNRRLQRRALRLLYETSGKEAKKIQERLGLAAAEELQLAKDYGAFNARRKAYDLRRASEAAERLAVKAQHALDSLRGRRGAQRDEAAISKAAADLAAAEKTSRTKLAAFNAAEKELQQWTGTLSDAARKAALEKLRGDPFPERVRRKTTTDSDEPEEDQRLPLLEVLQSELNRIPKTLNQADQLLYRADMLRRLEAAGEAKGSLLPRSKPEIKFMHVEMPTLSKLLDKKINREQTRDDNTINGRTKELIKEKELKKALHRWPFFGPSFSTDGVSLHVSVVNKAWQQHHVEKQRNQSADIKKRAKGEVAMEVSDDEDEEEYEPNTKLRDDSGTFTFTELSTDVVITAVDQGRAMVLSAVRLGYVSEEQLKSGEPLCSPADTKMKTLGKDRGAVTITSKAYRHLAGTHQRRAASERRRRWRLKNDPVFAAAEKLLEDNKISTVDPALLLPVLAARGSVFHTMAKDGTRRAHARLHAHYAERSLIHRLGLFVLPGPNYSVLFGNCKSPGFPGAKLERYVRETWPSQVLPDMIEYRSSCLDSSRRCYMAHPPQRLVQTKTGRRYIKRVYGLYMSVMPGYSVLWNRDINAPINFLVRFWHEYHFGEAPKEFLYSTPREDLVFSKACSYEYTWLADQVRFKRSEAARS